MTDFYMTTGSVSEHATETIKGIGGEVRKVNEEPPIYLVRMPRVSFEVQDDELSMMYVIGYGDNGKRARLAWRGNYPCPELTNAADTSLKCENDREDMPPLPVGVDELGPLDDHPF